MWPRTGQSSSKVAVALGQNRIHTQHVKYLTQRGEEIGGGRWFGRFIGGDSVASGKVVGLHWPGLLLPYRRCSHESRCERRWPDHQSEWDSLSGRPTPPVGAGGAGSLLALARPVHLCVHSVCRQPLPGRVVPWEWVVCRDRERGLR